jgi:diguanylate cyclase (GGDEF)-like protein
MKTDLRALLVEDSEEDAMLLVRHLSKGGYEPRWHRVDTAQALTAALERQGWDIIFADYSMPNFSGTQALKVVRERGIDTPFIFVSGTIGEETAVEAMRLGAHDYVMKDNLKRLLPAVERERREAQLRQERRRTEQEMQLLQTVMAATSVAADVQAALAVTLGKVCEATDWILAQAWLPHAAGTTIECSAAWYCRADGMEKFRTASLGFAFAPGEDLPGQVWSRKQALWLPDLAPERDFARAAIAREAGLGSALGIPVLADDDVLAVLEFFTRDPRAADERLIRLVAAVVEQLGSVIQRKRADQRLHYLAHYDSLTALPNRVLLVDRLNQAILEANRHNRIVGVAFLDLDRFKTINDSLGHGIGDLLIKSAGERLTRCVREGDTVARLAGDEFTLILSDMGHIDHATHVANKILDNLTQPFHIGGHELYTSASLGMTFYPYDESGVEGLLHNADIAMYRAKARGGNSYVFYSAEMMLKAQERLSLENDLRHALDHAQLLLHYQPQVELATGRIETLEALVRWRHPQRGLIPPTEFIPLAEESGLILSLGEYVLNTACDHYEAHRGPHAHPRLAVNISVRQFQQLALAETISGILGRHGFDPADLELEITESLLLQNVAGVLAVMHNLSQIGIRFSVDDFGTGYSSLAYLKSLPISRVKIDRSFVRGIPEDPNDVAIVTAIISMAHDLGIKVVAEGVETRAQFEFLLDRGCDAGQGSHFSPPLPAEGSVPWFAEDSRL